MIKPDLLYHDALCQGWVLKYRPKRHNYRPNQAILFALYIIFTWNKPKSSIRIIHPLPL